MKLLTVREAAELLGLSPTFVYGLCARKKIRHERHGLKAIRIPEDAMDEYRRGVTIPVKQEAAAVSPPVRVKLKHLA